MASNAKDRTRKGGRGRSSATAWIGVAAGCVACIGPYKPPTTGQPHALVRFNASYVFEFCHCNEQLLREQLEINDQWALSHNVRASAVQGTRTFAFLAHPGTNSLGVGSIFYWDPDPLHPLAEKGRRLSGSCFIDKQFLLKPDHERRRLSPQGQA